MKRMIGEIKIFTSIDCLENWVDCDGRLLDKSDHPKLFEVLQYAYGGDGDSKFAIPDLRGRIPVGTGSFNRAVPGAKPDPSKKYGVEIEVVPFNVGDKGGTNTSKIEIEHMPPHHHVATIDVSVEEAEETSPSLTLAKSTLFNEDASEDQYLGGIVSSSVGSGESFTNNAPTIGLRYCISIKEEEEKEEEKIDYMIGEIRLFAGATPPEGWIICGGQKLEISKNTALFSLMGTNWGGNGRTDFVIPNFQCRAGIGSNLSGSQYQAHLKTSNGIEVSLCMKRFWAAPLGNNAFGGGGTYFKKLSPHQIPPHHHDYKVKVSTEDAEESTPSHVLAQGKYYNEEASPGAKLGGVVCETVGEGKPLTNYQPYLTVNYIICVRGGYPSRS